jgi:acyl-CoA thioesterase
MTPRDDLDAALTVERTHEPSVFRLRVLPGWEQGRGAFGGVVLGALTRAMVAAESETERLLRSISGAITAPVLVGDAEIRVTELRRGNAVSTYDAVLSQEGEVRARATAILGRSRADARRWSPPPPALVDPDSVRAERLPMAPGFAQHFEFRSTGPQPFAGGTDPIAEGFVRADPPPPVLGPAEAVAYVDAWWPASFVVDAGPRPMATVAFTMQYFPSDRPRPADRPLRYRSRALATHDGYLMEMRELWTEHGELVALNEQTFVMIK